MPQTKEILKEIRKIEILTKHKVEGILQGVYYLVFKGRGIEFSEVREYMVGDDIRTIDWNVTARLNEPYVKEFIEERDLTVYIVFDISGSSFFGSEKSKKIASIELAASIMYSAVKNNDNIGLALFTTEVEHFIRPRKGRKHFLKLIRDMIYFKPKNKQTDLGNSFKFLSNVIKKKSIIFVISDFFDEGYDKYLKVLSMKNDVIAIFISSSSSLTEKIFAVALENPHQNIMKSYQYLISA
jgi:uncharacterized protein (DUF58 family)